MLWFIYCPSKNASHISFLPPIPQLPNYSELSSFQIIWFSLFICDHTKHNIKSKWRCSFPTQLCPFEIPFFTVTSNLKLVWHALLNLNSQTKCRDQLLFQLPLSLTLESSSGQGDMKRVTCVSFYALGTPVCLQCKEVLHVIMLLKAQASSILDKMPQIQSPSISGGYTTYLYSYIETCIHSLIKQELSHLIFCSWVAFFDSGFTAWLYF